MTAINNSEVINGLCATCNCKAFVASFTYVFDPTAKTVTVTDASTFDAGDTLKNANITVTSLKTGLAVRDRITAAAGVKAVNVASLDLTQGINIQVVSVTNARCVNTSTIYNVNSAVNLSGALTNSLSDGDI